ncbi:hypothetical protein Dimus_020370, partial [Dionaea muscipula]
RQKWERLFKRRELMHIDAIKEFYARLTLVHYKKKDVARSRVRGVDIEFDNLRLASILGVPGNNSICEYINEVWEESKYTKPLEITRKFANNNMIMEARRVRSVEMKPFQRFVHFLVMKNVVPRVMMRHISYVISMKDHELPYGDWLTMVFELKRENGVYWLGSGENRRRDDEEVAPVQSEEVHEEEQNPDFDWEAVVDEAVLQRESELDDQFYDAQVEVEEPVAEAPAKIQQIYRKNQRMIGVDPSGPTGSIPDSVFVSLQAEFERARANRIQADLEKAQTDNARLLSLLQQAQSQPKP